MDRYVKKRLINICTTLAVTVIMLGCAILITGGVYADDLAATENQETITVTLHASSREGDDFVAPIVIENVPKSSTYKQALETIGKTHGDISFATDGYSLFAAYATRKSMAEAKNADELYTARLQDNTILNEDTDIYYPYNITTGFKLKANSPKCGMASETPVEVETAGNVKWATAISKTWIKGASDPGTYQGQIEAGKEYYAYIIATLDWGYLETKEGNPRVNVEGGEFVRNWMHGRDYGFIIKLTAVHNPDEPIKENVVEATCTEDGSYVEVINCKVCSAEVSRTHKIDPALGHRWDSGKVTKAPTIAAEGERTYTCAVCGATKTEKIAKLKPSMVLNKKLPKVTNIKPKASKKALTVKWKKLSKKNRKKVQGIEVQIATNKKFTQNVKIKPVKKTKSSLKIRKLKSKKTYWVRVRTYKKINGVKNVNRWSKARKIRVK